MTYVKDLERPLWHVATADLQAVCGAAVSAEQMEVNGLLNIRCPDCSSMPLATGEPMSREEALAVLRRVFEERVR